MSNRSLVFRGLYAALLTAALTFGGSPAGADGNLQNVNHIILMMQENRSFDNYLGVLPYVTGTPYHSAKGTGKKRACKPDDHTCVDGLSCSIPKKTGVLTCTNSNVDINKKKVKSFHETTYCAGPDFDHSWAGVHLEASFKKPGNTLKASPMDGFVHLNDLTNGGITPGGGQAGTPGNSHTMGYFTDADLPFYYGLAETFAIDDRYFCSVLGQTFPNRSYFLAATSFGHLTTNEIIEPGGYKPITGTIFDRLDAAGVSWVDYFSDLPYSDIFGSPVAHQKPVSEFATDAAAGALPAVAFVDPSVGVDQVINGSTYEDDEHPPNDVRAGEYFVSQIITALRNSPNWNDSVLLLTYDEHGGFYDHVQSPAAPAPDNIAPGQCADASNPPTSEQPGGGVNCTHSATVDAPGIVTGAKPVCPSFSATGPYPATCPAFNQLGIRVPFVAVSPFAKTQYVSHTVGDHTSMLALIEKRFNLMSLTARDAAANDLEDMFDFDASPSLNATIPTAPLPTTSDPGCPFVGPTDGD